MRNILCTIIVCCITFSYCPSLLSEVIEPTNTIKIDLNESKIYEVENTKYIYLNQTWYRGAEGHLIIDGKIITAKHFNKTYKTPWGVLYWHGGGSIKASKGWLPYPLVGAAIYNGR